ncbi:MAG: hypothetical protein AMXMBFR33_49750 [Candidatus Xenobia bacterium]
MRNRRGLGLGTALIVVALLATIGLLIASLSVTHLGLMARESNQAIAGDLARSVLALSVERIFRDKTVGTPGQLETLTLPAWEGAPADCEGVLSFDPTEAANRGIPLSLNNLLGGGATLGAGGQVVPVRSVHLVAVGSCNGVRCQIEAILNVPPFPYAIAADGPVASSGQLEVGAAESSPPAGVTVDQLDPAVLFSNAQIALGPATTIQGDLKAAGSISLDPGTSVSGLVQPNQAPSDVPVVPLASFDPEANGQAFSAIPDVSPAVPQLAGRWKRTGELHYLGNLELVGAVLFVDGNLTVDGSLSGTGLIVTTGSLTIAGQAQMTSADQVALVSGGNLSLNGSGKASSKIRGVLYSEGNFSAQHLRLEGGLITHRRSGPPPTLTLDDVFVVGVGDLTRFSFPLGRAGAGSVAVPVNNCGGCTDDPPPNTTMPEAFTSILRLPDGSFGVGGHYTPGGLPFSLPEVYADLPTVVDPNQTRADLQARFVADRHFVSPTGTNIGPDYQLVLAGLGIPGEQVAGANEIVTFDPSQLVALSEVARVIYWRER